MAGCSALSCLPSAASYTGWQAGCVCHHGCSKDESTAPRRAELLGGMPLFGRHKQGRPLSALDGVPYTVIDGMDALPYPTTAGTTFVRPSAC